MTFALNCCRYFGLLFLTGFFIGHIPSKAYALEADSTLQAELFDSPKAIVDEAWQVVHQNYIDTSFNQVDWIATRKSLLSRQYLNHDQAYAAIRYSLQTLNDPYTRFLDPEQFNSLTQQTSGELTGVGIMLTNEPRTEETVIVKVLPNSPASRFGLEAGDYILSVNGKSTEMLKASQVSKLIQGEANSNVTLSIRRRGKSPFKVTLTRGIIQLQTVEYKVRRDFNSRIGYIKLKEFSSHASEQVEHAIRLLANQNVDAFILDLRGNPGGLLDSSIDITRMWLDKGLIVRTIERYGKTDEIFANNSAITNLPLAILVDQNSASSSEILTGALKDNNRAVVIGTKTFGKALVQSVHQLSDGSGLAVTVAHYYTPKGTDISRKGIIPDIAVPLSYLQSLRLKANTRLFSTNADPQYQRAIDELRKHIFGQSPRTQKIKQTLRRPK